MHTETAVHSGRDSLGRVITPGRHVLSLHGSRSLVDVTEDDCSNLGIQIRDRWYRLDELDPSAVLSRCDRLDGIPASLSNIDARLKIAQGYREELARVEKGWRMSSDASAVMARRFGKESRLLCVMDWAQRSIFSTWPEVSGDEWTTQTAFGYSDRNHGANQRLRGKSFLASC